MTDIDKGFAATVDQASDTAGSVPSIASDFETLRELLSKRVGDDYSFPVKERAALDRIEAALKEKEAEIAFRDNRILDLEFMVDEKAGRAALKPFEEKA